VSLGRLIGVIATILVLFAIITAPRDSAASVRNGLSNLGAAGEQVTVFLASVVQGISTSTASYPAGGVETGDGSTPTVR
jgi:hypothetical protein